MSKFEVYLSCMQFICINFSGPVVQSFLCILSRWIRIWPRFFSITPQFSGKVDFSEPKFVYKLSRTQRGSKIYFKRVRDVRYIDSYVFWLAEPEYDLGFFRSPTIFPENRFSLENYLFRCFLDDFPVVRSLRNFLRSSLGLFCYIKSSWIQIWPLFISDNPPFSRKSDFSGKKAFPNRPHLQGNLKIFPHVWYIDSYVIWAGKPEYDLRNSLSPTIFTKNSIFWEKWVFLTIYSVFATVAPCGMCVRLFLATN